ncbi:DUF167 domain-containing protein [Bdellovibrio sp. HCB337]|uniref:DUF167 domain-containing protein n=1 Tax=Bdellovibrio sp. HCB337 TaxID=3394358 RepID=UPI0039A5E315
MKSTCRKCNYLITRSLLLKATANPPRFPHCLQAKVITKTERGCRLSLFVQPKSSKNEIIGPHNGALKIKITAPPVDGKANAELVDFLSEILGIPKRQIEILKGETGRNKSVEIFGLSPEEIRGKLGLN